MSKKEKQQTAQGSHPRPSWLPKSVVDEEYLCPDCFKVVGERSRYSLVCMLGNAKEGMSVTELTEKMGLKQPTVTHHLQVLASVEAVTATVNGREKRFSLNRKAHCFKECKIPY